MSKPRRHFAGTEKVAILKRHLIDKVPISDLCDELDVYPNQLYGWLQEFFENGHVAFDNGRKEQRRCEATQVPASLRDRDAWKDLKSICRVTRLYQERGEDKSEVRYFISSLPAAAQQLGAAIRGHWGVENGLHWVLDMAFAEDRSRA